MALGNMAGGEFRRRAHVQNHILFVRRHPRELINAQILVGGGAAAGVPVPA